jgi:diguanylate cyclase
MTSRENEQKLLFKLLVQFMRFVQGQDKTLDRYLHAITQKLKQSPSIHSLQEDLYALSKALDHKLTLKKEQAGTPPVSADEKNYLILCATQLKTLINSIEIPAKFQDQAEEIQGKLARSLQGEFIDNIISSSVSLILEVNQYFLSEQHNTEKFLDNISTQLNLLDVMTQKASASTQESHSNHIRLNELISNQIENIKASTASAFDLNVLQQNITVHLQELTVNLQSHQQNADSKLLETQEQLASMSKRLKELEEEASNLRSSLKQAHEKAFIDPLTGLPNRLAYNEKIDEEFKYCKRYQTAMALIIWDIDYFKVINDTYGHKAGDKTLRFIAQLIQKNCRETDFVARYGGEEFAMILPQTTAEQAYILAEKIRCIVKEANFKCNQEMVHITISGGISDYQKGDSLPDDIFERADKALYQAKEQGRNRCIIYSP